MEARTKFERRILELKDQLPDPPEKLIKWAYSKYIQPVGFTSNGDIGYCGNCGKSFPITRVIGVYMSEMKARKKDPCGNCPRYKCEASYDYHTMTFSFNPKNCYSYTKVEDFIFESYCPHCQEKLTMHYANKRVMERTVDVSALLIYKGIQTWRNLKLKYKFIKGKPRTYKYENVSTRWISEKGTVRTTKIKRWYNDHDDNGKPLHSLTTEDIVKYQNFYGKNLYPELELTPYLKIRGGDTIPFDDTSLFIEGEEKIIFLKYLIRYPFFETLFKQNDYEAIRTFLSCKEKEIKVVAPSFVIMKRHHYRPEDLRLWIDMVILYQKAGKDIRNPRFICPENLQKGHEEAQDLYNKLRESELRKGREEWERTRPRDIWWFLDHHPEELHKCVGNDDYLYKLAEQFGGLNPGWHLFYEEFFDDHTGEPITIIRYMNEQGFHQYPAFSEGYEEPQQKERLNRQFEKVKGKFCGIEFCNDELTIKTLNSWDEYYEEGKTMHNCIESNGYWNKSKTLILSVRKGKEIVADVEVSLRTFKILQCWGPCNQSTPYREKIKKLIEENIHLIKERME